MPKPSTIDEYISPFALPIRKRLQQIRQTIHKAVPRAQEEISYAIPAITLNDQGVLSFAAWKHHIAMYPLPAMDAAFKKQLAPYMAAKSTLQFRHDQPLPLALIRKVAQARAKQARQRTKRA